MQAQQITFKNEENISKGLSTIVVVILWPGNKTSEYRVHKVVLYNYADHIFKRTIAGEIK